MLELHETPYSSSSRSCSSLAACNEAAPTDRLRVSGHVEATETRLAPEAGGRVLTLTVKEGDRVQPARPC